MEKLLCVMNSTQCFFILTLFASFAMVSGITGRQQVYIRIYTTNKWRCYQVKEWLEISMGITCFNQRVSKYFFGERGNWDLPQSGKIYANIEKSAIMSKGRLDLNGSMNKTGCAMTHAIRLRALARDRGLVETCGRLGFGCYVKNRTIWSFEKKGVACRRASQRGQNFFGFGGGWTNAFQLEHCNGEVKILRGTETSQLFCIYTIKKV